MKRVIILVVDALGIGALPDAMEFGDSPNCNTLGNVASAVGGLKLPNLESLGIGNLLEINGVPRTETPKASYGRMMEKSRGKDTTTGHWELAGLVLQSPFATFPDGFPSEIIDEFVRRSNCGGILGNFPASGTEIIQNLNAQHEATRWPIIYTSADSVFQIACNVDVVSLPTLYEWCRIARELLSEVTSISRVIARPYQRNQHGNLQRLGSDRRDYAVVPPGPTILDAASDSECRTIAIGKIEDIFCGRGISHSIHTKSNTHGLETTLNTILRNFDINEYRTNSSPLPKNPTRELVFVNLVETDSLYGHRRDASGFANALEEIDGTIGKILPLLDTQDLLLITGDHGCDPTAPGTDHTREYVPLLAYTPLSQTKNLGTLSSFTAVAALTSEWLDIPFNCT